RFATAIPFSSGGFTAPQPDSPPNIVPAMPQPGPDWVWNNGHAPGHEVMAIEVMYGNGHHDRGYVKDFHWDNNNNDDDVIWWRVQ
ncbi:hypothetical protein, partial [Salmonella sp. SAL4443]|uniref:hypothetical protein n=1 Tax=Salmonella sp. SAL4443 TaxID=3159898 RepID=UPI00397A13F9